MPTLAGEVRSFSIIEVHHLLDIVNVLYSGLKASSSADSSSQKPISSD